MKIIVDFRESDLLLAINNIKSTDAYKSCEIITDNLPIGDMIIKQDDDTEVLLIERKTLSDLAASIRDKRYNEQSFRLNNCSIPNHNIHYMIEGNIHKYKSSKYGRAVNKESLISAMTSLSYTKGFSLVRTFDITESALWLLQTADKLSRIKDKGYYDSASQDNPHNQDDAADYVAVSNRVKKSNITTENIGAIMLAQIPSVSTASAQVIMERYKTIDALIDSMRENDKCIQDLTTTTKSGKQRKLTKTCTSNVYNYLLGSSTKVIDIN
uniref:ERCC4 domain-containing protein n=1 Tax=viral metagenome TaxID=1070528 RepID=A0A6C0LGB0_9ZZZZ